MPPTNAQFTMLKEMLERQENKLDKHIEQESQDKKDLRNEIKQDIREEIYLALKEFWKENEQKFASKAVEKIVYGAVGMILTSVFWSLIYLVIIK